MGMSQRDNQGGLTRGYRFGVAVNVFAICLLGTALAVGTVAAVRQLSFRTDLRFDTTHDQRYTLDPLAKKLLRSTDAPLEIWYCWGFDADLQARVKDGSGRVRGDLLMQEYYPILQEAQVRIRQVLQEWARATPNVQLTVAFQERQAMQVEVAARDLGIEPQEILNKVILRHAGRRLEVPLRRMMVDMQWGMLRAGQQPVAPQPPRSWRVREELVAALRSITSGETIPVGVAKGLRSRFAPGAEGYETVARMLQADGFEPVPVDLSAAIPDRLKAIILGGPRTALDPQSVTQLLAYERRGGRVLVFASCASPEKFSALLEPYGISLPERAIADDSRNRPAHQPARFLESDELCVGEHEIIRGIKKRVRVFMGISRPLTLQPSGGTEPRAFPLMAVSPFAQSEGIRFDAQGRLAFVPGRRQSAANACIAAAGRRLLPNGEEARIVIFGSEDLLQTRALLGGSLYGNRDLLLNSLYWLTESDRGGSIPRTERRERWIATRKLEAPFTVIAVIIMPLLAMATGVVVFYLRRS